MRVLLKEEEARRAMIKSCWVMIGCSITIAGFLLVYFLLVRFTPEEDDRSAWEPSNTRYDYMSVGWKPVDYHKSTIYKYGLMFKWLKVTTNEKRPAVSIEEPLTFPPYAYVVSTEEEIILVPMLLEFGILAGIIGFILLKHRAIQKGVLFDVHHSRSTKRPSMWR